MINTDNILTMGDSWASAVEADTGLQYGGWPEMLGVPDAHRCAIPGSNCHEWFTNKDHRLNKALDIILNGEADLVVISLLGSGMKNLDTGKFNERQFIIETADAMTKMAQIVTAVHAAGVHTLTLFYANPFPKNSQAETIVNLMNSGVKNVSKMSFSVADAIRGCEDAAFDGKDIHLTRAGHELVATAFRKVLELMPGRYDAPDTVGGVAVV